MLLQGDETEKKGLEAVTRDSFKEFLLRQSAVPFLVSDGRGKVLECNDALLDLVGAEKDGLERISWDKQLIPVGKGAGPFFGSQGESPRSRFEAILFHTDGSQSFVEVVGAPFEGEKTGPYGTYLFDITKYRENEEKLRRQALHDPLTGLPNRALMSDRLMEAIASMERGEEGGFAILFLDIDDFKGINDDFGHDVGDKVLSEVGRRIQQGIRKYDKASRWGGDEFVVFFGAVADKNGIKKRVRELLSSLNIPIEFEGETIQIGVSVGLVFNEGTYINYRDMLLDADRAMYRAKKSGGNCFVLHEVNSLDLDEWDNPDRELEMGMQRGELFLEYQPIVRISDGKMVGVEALIRWRHPQRGLIPPQQILGIADAAGLSGKLSLWVVDRAAADQLSWNEKLDEYDQIYVHLNCPGSLLEEHGFNAALAEKLDALDAPGTKLYLELPKEALEQAEGMNKGNSPLSRNFRGMVAVDDLSLTIKCLNFFYNLETIPFDVVKIDKSIVQYICQDKNTRETLLSFVKIFSSMGLSIVAKNVETQEQYETLKALNCTYAQGYYISAPVNVCGISEMLPSPLHTT